MNHTPFNLEQHVRDAIERIAEERAACGHGGSTTDAVLGNLRQRIGSALIGIGERVGGPDVRRTRPATPQPTHTPLLGF